jgi:plasmid maintenance system antidote protein VapI
MRKGSNLLNSVQNIWMASSPAMVDGTWSGRNSPEAQRLELIRQLLEKPTQRAFADFLGISPPRLANIAAGAPIGKDLAFTIVKKVPGITTDWLWFGKTEGLSFQIAQRLEALQQAAEMTKARA